MTQRRLSGKPAKKKRSAKDKATAAAPEKRVANEAAENVFYFPEEDRAAEAESAAADAGADGAAPSGDELARKIAELTPGLSPAEQGRIYQITIKTLEVLVRDQMTQIRQTLAEVLKNIPSIAPDVIRELTEGRDHDVSEHIHDYAHVLSDDDLVLVITSDPIQGVLEAISRNQGAQGSLAHGIDRKKLVNALGKANAHIREELLGEIIDKTPRVRAWNSAMTRRPNLPGRTARRISEQAAQSIFEELREKVKLDEDTLTGIMDIVEQRLEGAEKSASEPTRRQEVEEREEDPAEVESQIEGMYADGTLTEEAISDALYRGQRLFVIAAVARMAGVGKDLVNRAVRMRSAKSIVAIAWKAGFSMRLAMALQLRLAGMPPARVMQPGTEGDFPMGEDAMAWHIEFLMSTKD